MKTNKKGAIELSMSTIIVIIIGITLLSLGLMWVKGTFGKITDLSDKAFGLTDDQITAMFDNSETLLKISPNNEDVKQGNGVIIGVIFYNLETDELKIKAKVTPVNQDISCVFADTQKEETLEYKLKSGANKKVGLIIQTNKNTALGIKSCNVEVISDLDTSYSTLETATVNVIKK